MSVEKKKKSMPKRERVVTLPRRGPASPLLSQQNPLPWRMEFDLTKGQGSHVFACSTGASRKVEQRGTFLSNDASWA